MPLKAKKKFLVTEPRVFVIGCQKILQRNLTAFLRSEGFPGWKSTSDQPGEIIPEVAGRVCYLSFGKGREHPDYIENLKRDRHGSVLEHAVVTFILTGVSRSFTHECVRHRAGWAYSQLSQRFVDEGHAQYVVPWAIQRNPSLVEKFRELVETNIFAYYDLQRALREIYGQEFVLARHHGDPKFLTAIKKVINGAARSILANATETKITCTVNARAFRHFLEMRCSLHADHEIRAVAFAIYLAVLPHWPDILDDYRVEKDEDGIPYLTTDYQKV